MASSLNLVLQNFAWRIDALTPTDQTIIGQNRFIQTDPFRIDPEQSSGLTRHYSLLWTGGGAGQYAYDQAINDNLVERTATHTFDLRVYYHPSKIKYDRLQWAMAQDRHDLHKQLRDPDKWVGYNDSNTSTDLGVYDRYNTSESVDYTPTLVTVSYEWTCVILESEV